jgi:hypothetical protein
LRRHFNKATATCRSAVDAMQCREHSTAGAPRSATAAAAAAAAKIDVERAKIKI